MRSLLLVLFFSSFAHAQALEDAVREIAKSVLGPGEIAHVSERSIAPEFAAETTRAKNLMERALRRPTPRDARMVEVVVTATENIGGLLLVVQIQKDEEQSVETAPYISQPAPRITRPSLAASLLWRQPDPILDIAIQDDRMLVLSPSEIQLFHRTDGMWTPAGSLALAAMFPSRDPRGRLLVSEETFTAFLSGGTCPGKWKPSLEFYCIGTTPEFDADGEKVHFTMGENTLATESGEQIYSLARAGNIRLVASIDGRIHVMHDDQAFTFEGWGSDIASFSTRCNANPLVMATSPASDALTAYDVAGPNPRPVSDPLPMQGTITALWPASGGTMAVVHEAATGRYAAYLVSLDCGN